MIRSMPSKVRDALIGLAVLVTAAVTFGEGWNDAAMAMVEPGDGTGVIQVQAMPAVNPAVWEVIVTNIKTGHKMEWTGKTFSSEDACKKALGNLPAIFAALASPTATAADVPDEAGIDPDLESDTLKLLNALLQNTGAIPALGASCELKGDPA